MQAASLFDRAGRVALVTGGNTGLGRATAQGFAEAGADVVIASRHEDELKSALDEVPVGTGRRGHYVVADVSKRDEVKKLARTAVDTVGRVVRTSSIMGHVPKERRNVYSATKAALIGMARASALDLGPYNVTVNCIAPGPFPTDLPMSILSAAEKKAFADRTALGRWGGAA